MSFYRPRAGCVQAACKPSVNRVRPAPRGQRKRPAAFFTARREMFMRLLRAEARLEGMTRRWPCVIFSQRPDFGVPFASPNIEELTGTTPSTFPVPGLASAPPASPCSVPASNM